MFRQRRLAQIFQDDPEHRASRIDFSFICAVASGNDRTLERLEGTVKQSSLVPRMLHLLIMSICVIIVLGPNKSAIHASVVIPNSKLENHGDTR